MTETAAALAAPDMNQKPAGTKYLGGSRFDNFNHEVITQAVRGLWLAHSKKPAEQNAKMQSVVEAMAGIAPQDEMEGMLASQMLACHHSAMECFRRAMLSEQTFEGRNQNLNYANKLLRTYASHLEALDKHRGKGQQKVTVEHVHVHQGGQAIVGNVTTGGTAANSQEQPHAKQIANAHEPAMQGTFTSDRQALPVPGHA